MHRGSWKYQYNEDVFKRPLSDGAEYWLGLIVTDGCITNRVLRISLSGEDQEHIRSLKDFLGGGGLSVVKANPNAKIMGKTVNKKESLYLSVCNQPIVRDLTNLGITSRKSLTVALCPEFVRSANVWRVVFDGNGTI